MLTSLPKHRGQHGGLIAVLVLVSTSVVVWTTQRPPPAPHEQPVATAISSSAQRPAATVAPPDQTVATITPVIREGAVTGTGVVAFDETRTSHVVVPVSGWFEKKRAHSVGRYVRQFEPLGVVYSVEVYAATADLIKQVQTFESQELVNAARVKLLRWGMPKPMLDQIEQRMTPQAGLPIVSRVAGTVVAEQGTRTGFVEPGELFTVTDPSHVMVFVEVPEAAQLRVGMPAKLMIDGVKRPLAAKVSYVFRRADEGLRTVRFDVRAKLEPGAKVDAVIQLRPL
jgi:membrane fusion protein, copper/silver efflux system